MEIEKEEHWRLRLIELMGRLTLKQTAFAKATDIDLSYVSRLLYEPGKKGRKNLGPDTMAAIRKAFDLSPGWFDLPLGTDLPPIYSTGEQPVVLNMQTARQTSKSWGTCAWPFVDVSEEQYNLLNAKERMHLEQDILIRIEGRATASKQPSPAPDAAAA